MCWVRMTYVEDHRCLLGGARARGRAHLDGERRVLLGRVGADLLAEHKAGKRKGCCYLLVHDGQL
jgi:hypothetical protein